MAVIKYTIFFFTLNVLVSDEGCFRNVSCALRNIILDLYFLNTIIVCTDMVNLHVIEIFMLKFFCYIYL